MGRNALETLLPPDRYERVLALACRRVGRGFHFAKGPTAPLLLMDADAWTVCRPALRRILAEGVAVERARLHDRVTLLGDAAHAMPQQRGNSAFEDARLFIASEGCIAAYEREMFQRAKRTVEESDEAARLCHVRNPVARSLRNGVLATIGLFSRSRQIGHEPS